VVIRDGVQRVVDAAERAAADEVPSCRARVGGDRRKKAPRAALALITS
jgi:hypothetical protein